MVPNCLVPRANDDILPDGEQRVSLRLFGPELSALSLFICRQLLI
jgi:hypothetical protein